MNLFVPKRQATTLACVVLSFVLAIFPAYVSAETQGMTAVDMVELTRISDLAMSPNGKQVIYLRTEVDWNENEIVKRLRLVSQGMGEAVSILEAKDATESFNEVAWLPSRNAILTALERDDDEHDQAYVYDLDTFALTRLTNHPTRVEDIVVPASSTGFYFRAAVSKQESNIGESNGAWSIEEYESVPYNELWYADLSSRESARVIGGAFDVRSYEVSRDGSKILYVQGASALLDEQDRELWLYDRDTGRSVQVTDNTFPETNATLSPDHGRVAFIATVNSRGEPYYEDNVFVQEVGNGKMQLLLPKTPMEMNDVAWNKEGTGLYLLGNTGVRTHLYHYNLTTAELRNLTPGDHVIGDWTYDAALDTHSFLRASARNPGEVWALKNGEADARQVSFEYVDFEDAFRAPEQVVFSWRGRGSVTVEGLLVYPLGYQAGNRVPLVTITHGGPRSSAQFGSWNMSRYVPVLAAQGYAVFLPNYRGGTGYGDDFMRDMVGNYFRNSHRDVLDGIDALVDAGIADPDQLIKMGWSAGGHMTNKLITVSDRFRAASSGAGVADWVSMFGESDMRYNREPWFGGAPWTKRAPLKSYARQSPLRDAWRITTPTIFYVGNKDVRVPPTQAILMYRAAKAAGVETELYIAPDEKHQYAMPSHRLFKINKDLEWYATHLERPPYEPVYPEAKSEQSE